MIRRRLLVNGIVQGVGFRPFVHNLARSEGLAGFVMNTSRGVVIEVEGDAAAVERFAARVEADAPPLARVVSVRAEDVASHGTDGFAILVSEDTPGTNTLIPPDVAACADCLREVRDPGDRRHGYPFTNCTNCGPRWTIIGRIPYDRPFTSMSVFALCPACRREYDDPADRRFHAQPNACFACGPRVWLAGPVGATDPAAGALGRAAEALARHAVVAIKGLGGFHLAVRADAPAAVAELRRRKRRATKPLALMAADLAAVRRLAVATPAEEALLTSPQAPIVLLARKPDAPVADAVAPGHRRLGVMLPPTPLHHLLFDALATLGVPALVMTSGNLSDEPICIDNDDALRRLGNVADVFVLHDRGILRRADDSVVQVVADTPLVLRRSRGYAPVPVLLSASAGSDPVLAVGPELKNTVCLLKDGCAFVSPHIGDLANLEAIEFFEETVATLQDVLECVPEVVAHDLHPGYASTVWAKKQAAEGRRAIGVQHHHAHFAAVLAEHGCGEPALGVIMDGTGYGPDGTIWGGEFLVGDVAAYRRVAHFEPVPLPGGDAAIRAPWRQAVSYLRHAYGPDFFRCHPDEFRFQGDRPVEPVLELLARGVNAPLTSSCGRLFDAVAAIVGPWTEATYEAQAAIELVALTEPAAVAGCRPFAAAITALEDVLTGSRGAAADVPIVLPVAPIVKAVREARRADVPRADLSAMFHRTLIDLLAGAAVAIAGRRGLRDVVLGGGVFQNEIILEGLATALADAGLRVLRPRELPPGDGAIALGQAVVAAHAVRS